MSGSTSTATSTTTDTTTTRPIGPTTGRPTTRRPRAARRLATLAVLTGIGLAVGAGVASAHVTVTPSDATQGSYSTLTFRVPNESATASTIGVVITIPADTPIASVRFRDQPGWTAEAVTTQLPAPVTSGHGVEITEAVSTITFTADEGTAIGPGAFGEFAISVGPLPEVDAIVFPTTQRYDDGTEVAWDQPTPADGAEPEHPAPTLRLTAATGDDHDHGETPATSAGTSAGTSSVTSAPSDHGADGHAADSPQAQAKSDTAARILGVVGLIVAALALLVATLGYRHSRAHRGPKDGAA